METNIKPFIFLCCSLRNPEVVDFVKSKLAESYKTNFKTHKSKISQMVSKAFEVLAESQKDGVNVNNLKTAVNYARKSIFKIDDAGFWFSKIYNKYKFEKASRDWEEIKKYIQGPNVLDFGCGLGHLSLKLEQNGYKVLMFDLSDNRIPEARNLDFIEISSSGRISQPPKSINTAIVKSVFHHLDKENIPIAIGELARVSKRVIVGENTFDVPNKISNLDYLKSFQPFLKKFSSMEPENQLMSLVLTDFFANTVVGNDINGKPAMNFKTIKEWEKIFQDNGFTASKILLLGFEKWKMTPNCEVWMILERT